MSTDAPITTTPDTELALARQDLQFVLEEIITRLDEGLEGDRSLDIQSLVGESHRISKLLGLHREPISWGEYFRREPFRKHLTCGWPGLIEHPWKDTLDEHPRETAVSLCLVVSGPYEDDEDHCFILAVVGSEELYDAKTAWQRCPLSRRIEGCQKTSCLLRRWVRYLKRRALVLSGVMPLQRSWNGRAQVSPELTDEELQDVELLTLRHRQVLVALLHHFKAIGPDASNRPTRSRVGKLALLEIGESEQKRILSQMVKFRWLENGAHHSGQRGYYLTSRGLRLAQHCYLKQPDAYRYGVSTD